MYSRDVQVKIYKNRVQVVHDWIFDTIPGVGCLATAAIVSASLFGSTLYTILVVGTFMFLLGHIVGHRKEGK